MQTQLADGAPLPPMNELQEKIAARAKQNAELAEKRAAAEHEAHNLRSRVMVLSLQGCALKEGMERMSSRESLRRKGGSTRKLWAAFVRATPGRFRD